MATTTHIIGTGETYTDLSAWETGVGSSGGEQIAILKEDINDNVTFSGWPSAHSDGTPSEITIKGDLTGVVKRVVTSKSSGSNVLYFADVDISAVTIEDLTINGSGQASSKSGVSLANGTVTLTLNRVRITNTTLHGVLINASSATTTTNIDNCIFDNNDGSGYRDAHYAVSSAATIRNCLFAKNGGNAQNLASSSALTVTYRNCLSFGNSVDFGDGGENSNVSVLHCVSEDSSATTGHDTVTECIGGQTGTGSYFRDYTNDDYTLRHDDFTNWGINGDSANTPAKDFSNRTRVNNDIGPFEYVQHMVAPAIDQTLTMKMARGLADHEH